MRESPRCPACRRTVWLVIDRIGRVLELPHVCMPVADMPVAPERATKHRAPRQLVKRRARVA